MRWMLALVLVASCAASNAATAPTRARTAREPLQEKAAALFDAAVHGDALRLKTLVDWSRWRTFAGLQQSTTDDAAAAVLSRVETEPQPSAKLVDDGAKQLMATLAAVASGPLPPQPCAGVMNATLAAWRRGAPAGAPPSLARLRALVADSLEDAREVTYEGTRRVTLVFVGELLVGVLAAP